MSDRRGRERYYTIVSSMLSWLDSCFSPDANNQGLPLTHWQRAWSWRAYDLTLLLAVAYPVLSLTVIWAITNESGQLGDLVVLAGGAAAWKRIAVLLGLLGILIFSRGSRVARRRGSERVRYLSLALAVGTALLTSLVIATTGPTGYLISAAVVFALAVALFAAALRALILMIFGPAFRPIAGLGIIGITIFSYAATTTLYFDGTSRSVLNWQFLALTGFLLFSFVLFEIGCYVGRHALAYCFFTSIIYAFLVWSVGSTSNISSAAKSTVIFLGFFPLLNAVFDFISIGLTRWCLRRGLQKPGAGILLWSSIDALTALLLFALLGMATIFFLFNVGSDSGEPIIAFPAVFSSIRSDPNAYWWLYVSFFSTLIPTVIHLGVASWSFVTFAPNGIQDWIRTLIQRSDTDGLARASAIFSLASLVTFSVALPILSIYFFIVAIWHWYPNLGFAYLWLFEMFLTLLR